MFQQPQRLALLAEAHLQAGDDNRAAQLALRALQLARRFGERGGAAQAERALATIAAARGATEAARRHYRRAAAAADALGMRPLAALCRLELGELLAGTGGSGRGPATGQAALRAAATAFRELAWRPIRRAPRTRSLPLVPSRRRGSGRTWSSAV